MPTTSNIHTEHVFENELCAQLAAHGWRVVTHLQDGGTKATYSRELAILDVYKRQVYKPPRKPHIIAKEIQEMEKRFVELMKGVVA